MIRFDASFERRDCDEIQRVLLWFPEVIPDVHTLFVRRGGPTAITANCRTAVLCIDDRDLELGFNDIMAAGQYYESFVSSRFYEIYPDVLESDGLFEEFIDLAIERFYGRKAMGFVRVMHWIGLPGRCSDRILSGADKARLLEAAMCSPLATAGAFEVECPPTSST
jgi:hypothetical protein